MADTRKVGGSPLAVRAPAARGRRVRLAHPTYRKDDHFFASETPRAAYWAGVLSDGTMSDAVARISLEIHQRDRAHLEWFVRDVGYTGPITERVKVQRSGRRSPMCRVQIGSAHQWIQDLWRRFSLCPRKSLTLEPPSVAGDEARAYVLGLLDANGSVSWYGQDRDRLRVTLTTGSRWIAAWVEDHFQQLAGRPGKRFLYTYAQHPTTFRVIASGADAMAIARTLLALPVPRLARKWSRVERVLASGGR